MEIIDTYAQLDDWIRLHNIRKVMLVGSVWHQPAFLAHMEECEARGLKIVHFKDYQPNPHYESVIKGVQIFRSEHCDGIIAVGGGSAMDVAKCIKLYSTMDGDGEDGEFLRETINPNEIPFLAMPTTAGTGSEATRFAVIYYKGSKQSVAHESCIPQTVLLDPSVLITLPVYQKKVTMLDALCHAVESFWSVNSTAESRKLSKKAIEMIMEHKAGYLANTGEGNSGMLTAANIAGSAINITQTTAGHAMCYKITTLFDCAHGHAAMLCDRVLYPWMIAHTDRCVDPRGKEYLDGILDEIGRALGGTDAKTGAEIFAAIFEELQLYVPTASENQFKELKVSVNTTRLKNHPIALDEETIDMLYHQILRG